MTDVRRDLQPPTGDRETKDRAERERAAYDEGEVWETSGRWHGRFRHVFESPNSRRAEARYAEAIAAAAVGRRVLELGCGDGENAAALARRGAGFVLGIDVAETFVARAQARAIPGTVEFRVGDALAPIDGRFDAIVGRSILHHIDYRIALPRLYERTLAPGGAMIFMEPLLGNLLIRLYTRFVPKSHTADERSFDARDLAWFEGAFPEVEVYPFNYATLPIGLLSSVVARSADNAALRAADRFDTWLARRGPRFRTRFRQAIINVRKPA